MNGPRIHDLERVEVEHYLGATSGTGMVKLRAVSGPAILLGELSPDEARSLARDLTDAAARAAYEQDLAAGMRARGADDRDVVAVLVCVREGEHTRNAAVPNPEEHR